jgi:hypothetical protein
MGPYLRLRRDSYEDACNRLLDFGLVRYARPGTVDGAEPPSSSGLNVALATVFLKAWTRGDRYEPRPLPGDRRRPDAGRLGKVL